MKYYSISYLGSFDSLKVKITPLITSKPPVDSFLEKLHRIILPAKIALVPLLSVAVQDKLLFLAAINR
jgi:hypothetical protein